jgi:hypothetical protein
MLESTFAAAFTRSRDARRFPMSHDTSAPSIDMVRWSFTVSPDHRTEIETHLDDLGADVYVRGEGQFTAIWEEPEGDWRRSSRRSGRSTVRRSR